MLCIEYGPNGWMESKSSSFLPVQHKFGSNIIVTEGVAVMLMQCPVGSSRNLEFGQDVENSPPTLREGHRSGIFNVQQLIPADTRPSLMSIQETAHTLIYHPACETLG